MAESTLFLEGFVDFLDFTVLRDSIESTDLLPRSDFFDFESADLTPLLSHDLTDFNDFLLLKIFEAFP